MRVNFPIEQPVEHYTTEDGSTCRVDPVVVLGPGVYEIEIMVTGTDEDGTLVVKILAERLGDSDWTLNS